MADEPPLRDDAKSYPFPSDRMWFDPRLVTANCSIVLTDFDVNSPNPMLVAAANSRRWMIGFAQPQLATNIRFAPWPDVDKFMYGVTDPSSRVQVYKLFDVGILVCNSWYALAGGIANLRVIEVLRN